MNNRSTYPFKPFHYLTLVLLSIFYIGVFVYFDSKDLSISSFKKSVSKILSVEDAGKLIKVGPDTYELLFISGGSNENRSNQAEIKKQ